MQLIQNKLFIKRNTLAVNVSADLILIRSLNSQIRSKHFYFLAKLSVLFKDFYIAIKNFIVLGKRMDRNDFSNEGIRFVGLKLNRSDHRSTIRIKITGIQIPVFINRSVENE